MIGRRKKCLPAGLEKNPLRLETGCFSVRIFYLSGGNSLKRVLKQKQMPGNISSGVKQLDFFKDFFLTTGRIFFFCLEKKAKKFDNGEIIRHFFSRNKKDATVQDSF